MKENVPLFLTFAVSNLEVVVNWSNVRYVRETERKQAVLHMGDDNTITVKESIDYIKRVLTDWANYNDS